MPAPLIAAAISAIPSIINLFTADDKSEATVGLVKTVASEASKALGLPEGSSEDEVLRHLEANPEAAVRLKELEYRYKYDIEALGLQKRKAEYAHLETMESEITERWKSDNSADSRFAKLLRPGLVAYLVLACTLLAIMDGNVGSFTIKESWVTLFTTLAITGVGGYFTLRTYEKRTGTSRWRS